MYMIAEESYTPNPYQRNRLRKDMEELAELERGFKSMDSALYDPEENKAPEEEQVENVEASDDVESNVESVENITEEKPQKYKKVNWQKRYSDLRRQYDKKLNEYKQLVDGSSPKYTVPKTREELEEFKNTYKDLYEVVESVAHLSAEDKSKELASKLETLQSELAKSKQEKAIIELNTKMPDWKSITNSDDFQGWASEQPDEIQRWVFNNPDNASLAIKAIKLYKADRNIPASTQNEVQSKTNVADAAASINVKAKSSVPKGQKKMWTTNEIAALSLSEYEKLSKEIDKAYQEGRVVRG